MALSVAHFDALYIGNELYKRFNDFSKYEVQMLSYMACLLSLYESNPVSFWGYTFIKREVVYPYSFELNDMMDKLILIESLEVSENSFLKLSTEATDELSRLMSFRSYQHRLKYLKAACQSLNILQYGVVKRSIMNEPLLKYSSPNGAGSVLNFDDGNPYLKSLYEQFELLNEALGQRGDNLLLPAVTWLTYISEKENVEEVV